MSDIIQKMEFTLLQLCLANAVRDERVEAYRYGNRHEAFLAMFEEFCNSENKPGIISVKELRPCKSKDSTKLLTPYSIAADYARAGEYDVSFVEATKLYKTKGMEFYNPFYLGQLYDSKRFVKVQSHGFRYGADIFGSDDAPPHMGVLLVACVYAPRNAEGVPIMERQFMVESCHMPLAEDHKVKIAKWLSESYPEQRRRIFGEIDMPIIRTGDFNTFKDMGETYEQQMAYRGGHF